MLREGLEGGVAVATGLKNLVGLGKRCVRIP